MPELPEVETIARGLDEVLPGRTIKGVVVVREKSFSGSIEDLVGKKIERVWRRAKLIVVDFEDWDSHLTIHLKMTGQLIFEDPDNRLVGGHPTADWVNELPSSHTRVIIRFEDGSVLYFNDQRVFGWVRVIESSKLKAKIQKMPPDVIDDGFTVEYLQAVLKRSQRFVKLVLLDQQKMGGLGNIYVCDALWIARVKPSRRSNRVTERQTVKLHEASVSVLQKGIELGGATMSDDKYVNTSGEGGSYQDHFLVYEREGEECLREGCEGVIKKVKMGGRGTYYCPACQK